MRRPIVTAVSTLMLWCTPAIAQDAVPATPAAVTPRFTLPPGEYKIERLVGLFAQHLRRNILFDPKELRRVPPVTLTEPLDLDGSGCEAALRCFLVSRYLDLLPLDAGHGLYEVICNSGPRWLELWNAAVYRAPEEILKDPNSKQMVTTVVGLQHVEAVRTANALRSSAGNGGWPHMGVDLSSVPNASGILLGGFQDQVAAAIRFCREHDKPPAASAAEKQTMDHIAALEREVVKLREQVAALQKASGGK